MNTKKIKILLVEDDENLGLVTKDYLEMQHYETTWCKDGIEGFAAFHQQPFDLCILDIMLPKKDGFALAQDIRKINNNIPIIFLTAKTLVDDRIKGFRIGCDDYITKPFITEELSLRIEAILKRCMVKENIPSQNQVFQIGSYEFDTTNMMLSRQAKQQQLTRKEAELLKLLFVYKNKLLSREVALKTIWGDDDYFIGRSMDVFITRLRKYLKEDTTIAITNIHGTGFKLEMPE